jgi:hypothetical protein
MKDCELKGCGRKATSMVVFQATLAPGVTPCLPWKWHCAEHAERAWCEVLFEHGKHTSFRSMETRIDLPLFEQFYAALRRRCVENNPGLWEALEEEGTISLTRGPSKLTEEQAEQFRQAAIDEGKTIREDRVPIQHMTREEAEREIAGYVGKN